MPVMTNPPFPGLRGVSTRNGGPPNAPGTLPTGIPTAKQEPQFGRCALPDHAELPGDTRRMHPGPPGGYRLSGEMTRTAPAVIVAGRFGVSEFSQRPDR